ncbi:MAG: ABC transporter permease [Bacteroidaceae bacterium]|nr:ABC transporter permease [Bacteroidaceae bacterium]
MFLHYLKIAIRNIRKFALQNTVSVIGLAAGFVCLSLSSVWLYYENSFDRFHKDADRIYTLKPTYETNPVADQYSQKYDDILTKAGNQGIRGISEALDVAQTTYFRYEKEHEGYLEIQVDSVFCEFFGIELKKGDWSFIGDPNLIAISEKYAKKLFADNDPIGQSIDGRTVAAVLKDFSKPTILQFDVMSYREVLYDVDTSNMSGLMFYKNLNKMIQSNCFFKLKEGADPIELMDLLRKSQNAYALLNASILDALGSVNPFIPIKDVHLNAIKEMSYVSYRTMSLFCMASILIMLCSLFNILIFFINTLKGRDREAALRIVHGASMKDLIRMFSFEMSILVIAGLLIGMLLIWVLKEPYIRLVDITMPAGFLVTSSIVLMLAVFLISLLLCVLSVYVIRRRSIRDTISDSRRNGLFRKLSVGLQLFTGILFAFITCVMLHQFNYLRNQNWGLKVNDQAVIKLSPTGALTLLDIISGNFAGGSDEEMRDLIDKQDAMSNVNYQEKYENEYGVTGKLASLPQVTQVISGYGDYYLLSQVGKLKSDVSRINDIDSCAYSTLGMLDEKGLEVLDVTVIDGMIPTDRPVMDNEVVITESLSKKLGLGPVSDDPVVTIESRLQRNPFDLNPPMVKDSYHVIAVIKDMFPNTYEGENINFILCTPTNYKLASIMGDLSGLLVAPHAAYLVRYEHGFKKELKKQLSEMFDEMDCTYEISFTEDQYFKGLEKDKHLKNLILIMGVICIMISIFGVWSMISLACLERRREIAVRKVHGAKVRDILSIFTKEYGAVIAISMGAAFITGYLIMHQWIQKFPRQATISWWIYAGIFAATVIVIGLTVIHKVVKTASENPADVIKSE